METILHNEFESKDESLWKQSPCHFAKEIEVAFLRGKNEKDMPAFMTELAYIESSCIVFTIDRRWIFKGADEAILLCKKFVGRNAFNGVWITWFVTF